MIPTFLDFQIVGPAVRPGRCSWIGVGLDLASRPLWRVARSPAPAAMHLRRPGRKVRPYSRAEDRAAETNSVPVADRDHAFAGLKRGYLRNTVWAQRDSTGSGGLSRQRFKLDCSCNRRRFARRLPRRNRRSYIPNVAALERSDNVADRDHAFAGLKRGYLRNTVWAQRDSAG
jgi:hypothetical protein